MLSKKQLFLYVLIFLSLLFLLIACKQNTNKDSNTINDFELEDVTLTFMMWDDWGQGFEENVKLKIEAEFPHITIENVGGDTGNKDWIEESLAAGIIPDIIFAHRQYHVALLDEYELGYDMSELLEKHQFELSRYEDAHLDEWKSWTQGEIWLLPFMSDVYALHYNKDIFDMFGVEYPTDGMTWNEVIELATKVTGEHNGVQYQGLEIGGGGHLPLTQVIGTEQLIDPETDDVLWVDNPYVKAYLEMVERVHQIQGNELPEGNPWLEERTLAMQTLWLDTHITEDFNFDIVTYPEWEGIGNIGPMAGGWAYGITKPSENKDAAMEVLKFLYADKNIGGLGESIIHAPFKHLFTGDVDLNNMLSGGKLDKFKDINLDALYKMKPAGGPTTRSKFDVGAFNQIENLNNDFIKSGLDVNTFLRELKEKEVVRILEEKGEN